MYVYVHIYTCIHIHIYIYICIFRPRRTPLQQSGMLVQHESTFAGAGAGLEASLLVMNIAYYVILYTKLYYFKV